MPGYLLTDGDCSREVCTQNCQECDSTTSCRQCQDGFFLDDDKCTSCSVNSLACSACQSATVCTNCHGRNTANDANPTPSSYFLHGAGTTEDSRRCVSVCPTGFFGQATADGQFCLPCGSNCTICLSESHCLACSSGHFLSSHTCSPCLEGCEICKSANTC